MERLLHVNGGYPQWWEWNSQPRWSAMVNATEGYVEILKHRTWRTYPLGPQFQALHRFLL